MASNDYPLTSNFSQTHSDFRVLSKLNSTKSPLKDVTSLTNLKLTIGSVENDHSLVRSKSRTDLFGDASQQKTLKGSCEKVNFNYNSDNESIEIKPAQKNYSDQNNGEIEDLKKEIDFLKTQLFE